MVRRLACRCRAIMTAIAGADHIRMIDPDRRCPGRVAVAVLAEIVGLNVSAVFASRHDTIMAT